jgi:hypothetical protein
MTSKVQKKDEQNIKGSTGIYTTGMKRKDLGTDN